MKTCRERGAVTHTVGSETSAPVKDGVSEAGVYAESFRAIRLACRSQQRECVLIEKGHCDSGLEHLGFGRCKGRT